MQSTSILDAGANGKPPPLPSTTTTATATATATTRTSSASKLSSSRLKSSTAGLTTASKQPKHVSESQKHNDSKVVVVNDNDDNSYKPLTLTDIRDRFAQLSQRVPAVPSQGLDPNDRAQVGDWAGQVKATIEEFYLLVACVSTATYKWGNDRSGAADQHLKLLSGELEASQEQITMYVVHRLKNILEPSFNILTDHSITTTTTTTTTTLSNTTTSAPPSDCSVTCNDSTNCESVSTVSNNNNENTNAKSATSHNQQKTADRSSTTIRELKDGSRASNRTFVQGFDSEDEVEDASDVPEDATPTQLSDVVVSPDSSSHLVDEEKRQQQPTTKEAMVVVVQKKQYIHKRELADEDDYQRDHVILCRNAVLLRQVVLNNFWKVQQCLSDYMDATQKDSHIDTLRGFAY